MIDQEWHPGRDINHGLNMYEESMWNQYWICFHYSTIMQNQGGEVWSLSTLETSIAIMMEMIGIMLTTVIFSNMLMLIDLTMQPVE